MSVRWLPALLLAVTAATGQQPAGGDDASARLHAAWLREVLDLDVRAAAADYAAIAQDQRSGRPERWVAVARLAELQRAGIPTPPVPAANDVPPPIRDALAAMTPLPVAELLQRAAGDPATLLASLATEAGRLPALRPVTPEAQDWVRRQVGRSIDDRWQRILQLSRRRSEASRNSDRANADDILRFELQGRQEQAANYRSLHFRDWRPPEVGGEPSAVLQRVRGNLDAWLRDPGLGAGQSSLLQQLRASLEQRAAVDAQATVALVARLPLYAERLLAEPPAGR